MGKKFLTVTSSSLQGIEIEKYHGYVSSNFVVGANIFKDFFAGFTDTFGGVSKSYTREIDNLKEMARENLENKARLLGMNAIIAFKADVDPIFSDTRSMFMVSATGTAVRISKEAFLSENHQRTIEDEIEEGLEELYISINSTINLKDLDFSRVNVYDLEEYLAGTDDEGVFATIEKLVTSLKESNSPFYDEKAKCAILREYALNKNSVKIKNYLNEEITREKSICIGMLDLIDYTKILSQFKNIKSKENELDLINCLKSKPRYISREEYHALGELIVFLKNKYCDKVEIKITGTLKKKENWVCKGCKALVEMDREVCHLCDTNRYGIKCRTNRFRKTDELIRLRERVENLERIKGILDRFYI